MRKESQVAQALIQQANHAAEKRAIQSVFDIAAFLASSTVSKLIEFRKKQKLFSQGEPAKDAAARPLWQAQPGTHAS